ncbi:alanyl-tRNA editing protein [Anoxybacterium hadale]|uniref:Alanyl-tRNA editing protein n=1 Tax=Anoxybacterium hadale TaxID=3408580 RepID=A0ACD1ADV4_9FIRM|nr:alanyl-tRNA editing protein [Clostridiales bacterium]
MTKKLYQKDVYQKEHTSIILEVIGDGSQENPWILVLDETIFFPTGGGQPCDLGTISEIPVLEVTEKEGIVYHRLGSTDTTPSSILEFKTGDKVFCQLDWERRFAHMQRHCGEHILSGIFFRELGGVNRGFHMGADYMTIDIDVPGITKEQAEQIETITNEVIWSNVPVTTRYFEDRSEAERLPLRKALAIDEDISIVCVGDENNPADCVACCGTHPSTSGQVGLVKIFKLENYKGMTRVYFNAGKGAFSDYQKKHRILSELNSKYSADDKDLLEKIKAQDEKNKEVRQELYQLKNSVITKAADEILDSFGVPETKAAVVNKKSSGTSSSSSEASTSLIHTSDCLIIREYPYLNVNDLLAISKLLAAELKTGILAAMISTRENLVILASSGGHDCGKLVKDNAPVWNGKGGGNAGGARAMFSSREDLECFVTFIRQAYQSRK